MLYQLSYSRLYILASMKKTSISKNNVGTTALPQQFYHPSTLNTARVNQFSSIQTALRGESRITFMILNPVYFIRIQSLPRKVVSKEHFVGRAGFEPAKVKTNRFTVCPRWPLEYLPILHFHMSSQYYSPYSWLPEPVEGFEPPTS